MFYNFYLLVKYYLFKEGYKLIKLSKNSKGDIKIYIDFINKNLKNIKLKNCEKINNKLKHFFNIKNIKYQKLTISSPGINRFLKKRNNLKKFIFNKIIVISYKFLFKNFKKRIFSGILLKSNKYFLKLQYNNFNITILKFLIKDIYKIFLVSNNFKINKIL